MFPRLLAPAAVAGRSRLQDALAAYYGAGHDQGPEAGSVTKSRAAALRGTFPGWLVGRMEVSLLHVAITNSVPTLFWMVVQIVSRTELLSRLRAELEAIVRIDSPESAGKRRKATVKIADLESSAPLLLSCFRETGRTASKQLLMRRVTTDTELPDPETGRVYLLRAGVDVHMPAGVTHLAPEVWGDSPDDFNPDRFLDVVRGGNGEAERKKKAAYIPFGGGKHYCPGRNFAIAETMGLVLALVMGFDVIDGEGGDRVRVPKMARTTLGHGVAIPEPHDIVKVKITKRKGWEDVDWNFLV